MSKQKVKVIEVSKYRDGGTIQYMDELNRTYFLWHPTGKVYNEHPKIGISNPNDRAAPGVLEIEVELIIVKSFTAQEVSFNEAYYTREKLIAICEAALVPQNKWNNRDSFSSQLGVGECLVMLKAGCEYRIATKENSNDTDGRCITDADTIWIEFWAHNFTWFDSGMDEDEPEHDGINQDPYGNPLHYYLPTEKRLEERAGRDWY